MDYRCMVIGMKYEIKDEKKELALRTYPAY